MWIQNSESHDKQHRSSYYAHVERFLFVYFSSMQHDKSVNERNLLFCQEVNREVMELDASPR